MSHFISQSLHSFRQIATQNPAERMLFLCHSCLYVNQTGIVSDAIKRLQKALPISNNKQQTVGSSGLPGLSGPPSAGTLYFFHHCDLVFLNSFFVFQKL
jgi:hypothetical protein